MRIEFQVCLVSESVREKHREDRSWVLKNKFQFFWHTLASLAFLVVFHRVRSVLSGFLPSSSFVVSPSICEKTAHTNHFGVLPRASCGAWDKVDIRQAFHLFPIHLPSAYSVAKSSKEDKACPPGASSPGEVVKEPRLPTGCGSAVTGGAGVADQLGAQQSLSRRVVRTHSGSISDSQAEGGGQ